MGIRCADHMTPLYPQKLALTSPTSGGRSVGIVRLRTKATELLLSIVITSHCEKLGTTVVLPHHTLGLNCGTITVRRGRIWRARNFPHPNTKQCIGPFITVTD